MLFNMFGKFIFDLRWRIQCLKVRRLIRRRFWQYSTLVRELSYVGAKELTCNNHNLEPIRFYSVNVTAQVLHKLKSITLLINSGNSTDAWPILRSLIESSLDHDYILRNPEKLELYFNYSTHLDIQVMKRLKERGLLSEEGYTNLESLEKEWETHKHLFRQGRGIRQSWRDKSLEDIGNEMGLSNIYSLTYRDASDFVHGNSNMIQHFVKGKVKQGVLLKAGPTLEENEIVIITSAALTLTFVVLMRANKCFGFGLDSEVKKLDETIARYHLEMAERYGHVDTLGHAR